MNNLTKTEALPKTGHVNEVCKEWLVREDGALAYKLQSQEINDFYKGNRFRNAVVREDFPTALNEQIKEHENAERQAEAYRRRLMEQEEHDKRVAREIAEKLERDLQEQQQRELDESQMMAEKMQEIYVNLPPIPPPASRDKGKPPPPRPTKASILQQQQQQLLIDQQPTTSNSRYNNNHNNIRHNNNNSHHSQQQPQPQKQQKQQQQQYFFNSNDFDGMSMSNHDLPTSPQKHLKAQQLLMGDEQQQQFNKFAERPSKIVRGPAMLLNPNENFVTQQLVPQQQQQPTSSSASSSSSSALLSRHQQYQPQHSSSSLAASTSSGQSARNVFETPLLATNSPISLNTAQSPTLIMTQQQPPQSQQHPKPLSSYLHTSLTPSQKLSQSLDELIDYSDVADSIRHYDISTASITTSSSTSNSNNNNNSSIVGATSATLAPDSIDSPTSPTRSHSSSSHSHPSPTSTVMKSNHHHSHNISQSKILSPSNENLLKLDQKFQKLSPEKYDQLVGNHDSNGFGINLSRPPLPMAATSSSNAVIAMAAGNGGAAAERHMQQHADDIELYVDPCDYASLREIGLPMEEIKEISKKMKQEQKDELLARRLQEMEANDNSSQEERDRLLAIEAQDKELARMLQEREKAKAKRAKEKARLRKSQQKDGITASSSNGGLVHSGPLQPLPPVDSMLASSTSSKYGTSSSSASSKSSQYQSQLSQGPHEDDVLDLEAYSNPIDVLQSNHPRHQNGTLTNGSLTRDSNKSNHRHHSSSSSSTGIIAGQHNHNDDDIYTLPVDSCRSSVSGAINAGVSQRPASLNIGPDSGILGHNNSHNNNSMTRSENYSMDSHESMSSNHELSPRLNFSKPGGAFDQSSSPTPPYMPIQGTRRSNSSEDRKKKSKDKCTHQ